MHSGPCRGATSRPLEPQRRVGGVLKQLARLVSGEGQTWCHPRTPGDSDAGLAWLHAFSAEQKKCLHSEKRYGAVEAKLKISICKKNQKFYN